MEFDDTRTQVDFARPLLETSEEHYVTSRNDPDLAVDGLEASVVIRLLTLLTGKGS